MLAANYLKGRIDARLHPTGHEAGPVGALDMGEIKDSLSSVLWYGGWKCLWCLSGGGGQGIIRKKGAF